MVEYSIRYLECGVFEVFYYDVMLRVWHLNYKLFSEKLREIIEDIAGRHSLRVKASEFEKNLSPEKLKELLNSETGVMVTVILPATYGSGRSTSEAEIAVRIGAYKDLLFLDVVEGWVRKPCRVK